MWLEWGELTSTKRSYGEGEEVGIYSIAVPSRVGGQTEEAKVIAKAVKATDPTCTQHLVE
jgi:hypothetical protein